MALPVCADLTVTTTPTAIRATATGFTGVIRAKTGNSAVITVTSPTGSTTLAAGEILSFPNGVDLNKLTVSVAAATQVLVIIGTTNPGWI